VTTLKAPVLTGLTNKLPGFLSGDALSVKEERSLYLLTSQMYSPESSLVTDSL
jgi:hypothetical protein